MDTCVYINTSVYTHEKAFKKEKFQRVHKTSTIVLVSCEGLVKMPFEYDVKKGTELQLR